MDGYAGADAPKKPSPVDEELGKQKKIVLQFHSEVERLALRLAPVLAQRAEKSVSSEGVPVERERSTVASQIAANTGGVAAAYRRLTEVTDMFEV